MSVLFDDFIASFIIMVLRKVSARERKNVVRIVVSLLSNTNMNMNIKPVRVVRWNREMAKLIFELRSNAASKMGRKVGFAITMSQFTHVGDIRT